jgi:hypothetical protein
VPFFERLLQPESYVLQRKMAQWISWTYLPNLWRSLVRLLFFFLFCILYRYWPTCTPLPFSESNTLNGVSWVSLGLRVP